MGTLGKTWKWTAEQKEAARHRRKETMSRPDVRRKLSQAAIKQWARMSPEVKLERANKISKEITTRWGNPGYKKRVSRKISQTKSTPKHRKLVGKKSNKYWSDSSVRKHHSKKMKKYWASLSLEERRKYTLCGRMAIQKPSKPQRELYNQIKQHYPTAELEFFVDNKFLDIAIPELKINIEYDGEYWHRNTQEKDARRDRELQKLGWRTLRVREGEEFRIEQLCNLIEIQYETKSFVFDIDGIVAKVPPIPDCEIQHDKYNERFHEFYKKSEPITTTIELMKKLHSLGHKIILHTSRWKEDEAVTRNWLFHYNVPFDQLIMNKPWAHFYIDDKHVTIQQLLEQIKMGEDDGD